MAPLRPTEPSVLPSAALGVIHIPAQVIRAFMRLPGARPQVTTSCWRTWSLNLSRLYQGYEILSARRNPVTRNRYMDP